METITLLSDVPCTFTEKNATALVVKPSVVSINPETLAVSVQVDAVRVVEAVPFQWGGKMLMKVVGVNTLTQGEKISVGQLAKKAIKAAGLVLPTAELKRPRKNSGVNVVEAEAAAEEQLSALNANLSALNFLEEDIG